MSDSENHDATPATPPLALNAERAAAALNIGERTLWTLTNRGAIPHTRIGRRLVYPVADLRRWLSERATQEGRAGR